MAAATPISRQPSLDGFPGGLLDQRFLALGIWSPKVFSALQRAFTVSDLSPLKRALSALA
jgi:hypothetical protein